jgi:uncharacterized protein YjdB
MKNIFSKILMAVALVVAPLAMSSCDNEDNWAVEQVVIKGEGISNKMGTIEIGQTLQLKAVRDFFVNGQGLAWKSSDESVATVDQNGLVKAVGVGEVVITAYTTGAKLSDSGEVTLYVVNQGIGLIDDQIDQSEAE